jgi:ribosomal protein L37AE/L43A
MPVEVKQFEREAVSSNDTFRLENHVCRLCFSRLVSRPYAGTVRAYVCTNCGATETGITPSVLCSCGITIRKPKRSGASGITLVDAGIRCVRNENPTPEFPSIFVGKEVE